MTNKQAEDISPILAREINKVGIRPGDCVLVHSNTDRLAQLDPEIAENPFLGFDVLKRALLEVVGPDGTIIVPTFTYSFCDGKYFDPQKRSSEVGLFSNFFFRSVGAVRSFHPVFSFAAIGGKAATLVSDVPATAFGADSVFDRIRKQGGKILFFNVPFDRCTYVHHIEEMHGVEYRYVKKFSGKIRINGQLEDCFADNFVRYLDRNVEHDFSAFDELMRKKNLISYLETACGTLGLCDARKIFEFGCEALDEDPHIFLAHSPN